jgi:hypothetical protein
LRQFFIASYNTHDTSTIGHIRISVLLTASAYFDKLQIIPLAVEQTNEYINSIKVALDIELTYDFSLPGRGSRLSPRTQVRIPFIF